MPASPTSGKPRPRKATPDDALEVLSREVSGLRVSLREIASRFQLRWEAELNSIQDQVNAALADEERRSQWAPFAKEAVGVIQSTRLRPKRGRLKDLSRIRNLAQALRDQAPSVGK